MATCKVKIEGQTIDLDESICRSNKDLVAALVPFYPGAANADIKRDKKTGVITVTKKAGSKGTATVVDALVSAPEEISRALLLDVNGHSRTTQKNVDDALFQMLDDEDAMSRVTRALDAAEPEPAHESPFGF